MTGVGSSPALATCETSHVLLAGVSSEVENIFYSLVAKEQMKYTCFSLHQFSLMHWEYAYILPKAIPKVVETIHFRKT